MATTSYPQRRNAGRSRWIIGGAVLLAVLVIAGLLIAPLLNPPLNQTSSTIAVTRGPIVATIYGSGTVSAERSLDLSFQSNGTVSEILVSEGQSVSVGDVLARLDDRELRSQLASAEAELLSAQAQLRAAEAGETTPLDLANAESQLASAEAQLRRTIDGNLRPEELAQAEAQLASAQAQLDALLDGPTADQLASAETRVAQAQASLEQTRASSSANKNNAETDLAIAANTLRTAQENLSVVYWETHESDGSFQYDSDHPRYQSELQRYNNAVRDEQDAQARLAQARITLENARAQEVQNLASAEASLRDAQAQLEALLAGPTDAELAQARATLAQAQANLAALRDGGTPADVEVAQASVEQARINLERLSAPMSESELEVRRASVARAAQSLEQARLRLEQATLRAPFAGIISTINIVPGSSSTGIAMQLVDRDPLHVDLRLNEQDVVRVSVGQSATLSLDSLRDWQATGVVDYIAPAAETVNGVVTYQVRVSFAGTDERVKVGMTAGVDLVTARKQDALLVPSSALLPQGAEYVVQVQEADGSTREVPVQVGLSDGSMSEIISGIEEGQQIVALPGSSSSTGLPGPFGN